MVSSAYCFQCCYLTFFSFLIDRDLKSKLNSIVRNALLLRFTLTITFNIKILFAHSKTAMKTLILKLINKKESTVKIMYLAILFIFSHLLPAFLQSVESGKFSLVHIIFVYYFRLFGSPVLLRTF